MYWIVVIWFSVLTWLAYPLIVLPQLIWGMNLFRILYWIPLITNVHIMCSFWVIMNHVLQNKYHSSGGMYICLNDWLAAWMHSWMNEWTHKQEHGWWIAKSVQSCMLDLMHGWRYELQKTHILWVLIFLKAKASRYSTRSSWSRSQDECACLLALAFQLPQWTAAVTSSAALSSQFLNLCSKII